MRRTGKRVGLAGVGLAAWLGLAGRGVAAEVDVAALKQEAVSEQSVSAAYALWKHSFTQDQRDSADAWWSKAKTNAAELMAAASTEAEKAEPEVALIRARLGRAATVLGLTKTPEQKLALLEAMKEAEPSDASLIRGVWRAFLADGQAEDEARAVRRHTRTGRPLGTPVLVAGLEAGLSRSLHRQKPGPKPKEPR